MLQNRQALGQRLAVFRQQCRRLEQGIDSAVEGLPGLFQHLDTAQPDDLTGHDGLVVGQGTLSGRLDNGQRVVEARPVVRLVADESLVLLRAAEAGLGITPLPRKLCQASLASGVLQRVPPAWTAGKVTTTLLMPHRRGQLPSVRAVASFLAARLATDRQA